MPRIALGVEYDGTEFAGWQSQANARSVQSTLETAVSAVADAPVTLHAAGRTDAGVHAAGQVAHFDCDAVRGADQWLLGINSNLPDDVAVRSVVEVGADFDARRSAVWRRYVYLIQLGRSRSALARRYAWWVREALDSEAMRAAAAAWIGEHDFSAFRAAGCQSTTPMRCLHSLDVRHDGEWLAVDVRANAFLYHMVRNLVGTLVEIGRRRRPVTWAAQLLAGRERASAGATAPACGLTLAEVRYPRTHAIPGPAAAPWFGYHAQSLVDV